MQVDLLSTRCETIRAFLKPTTNQQPSINWPTKPYEGITNQKTPYQLTTYQLHRPPINWKLTTEKFKDQKFDSKSKMNNQWRMWRCVLVKK